ncbi:hypothetical protein CCHR01_17127 [Colletotrichum chrysophilum]|uniref:Uncharacterized protein n=1 Tax=Colletotrichum chrysophilum TaxID=1836956 RepID=A0AAD9A2J3_9PEZI|nr:hypothetical protein CCHR01_17127 [Colletotrichum chrysophilum]
MRPPGWWYTLEGLRTSPPACLGSEVVDCGRLIGHLQRWTVLCGARQYLKYRWTLNRFHCAFAAGDVWIVICRDAIAKVRRQRRRCGDCRGRVEGISRQNVLALGLVVCNFHPSIRGFEHFPIQVDEAAVTRMRKDMDDKDDDDNDDDGKDDDDKDDVDKDDGDDDDRSDGQDKTGIHVNRVRLGNLHAVGLQIEAGVIHCSRFWSSGRRLAHQSRKDFASFVKLVKIAAVEDPTTPNEILALLLYRGMEVYDPALVPNDLGDNRALSWDGLIAILEN